MNFDECYQNFKRNPTPEALGCFSAQLEQLYKRQHIDDTKRDVMIVLRELLADEKYEKLCTDESILRIYKILGYCSQKLGAIGVYEQVETQGTFINSLKFHLQWAEEYAKRGDAQKFSKVLDLARERLKIKLSNVDIEAGFRDLADEYLKDDIDQLFFDPDDTMNLFKPSLLAKKSKSNKRRSSVCLLRQHAPVLNEKAEKQLFGPKTKTHIRPEFIHNADNNGFSIEEFRVALLNDDVGNDVEFVKEVSAEKKRKDSGIVDVKFKMDKAAMKTVEEEVENRMKESRRRHLSIVDEEKNLSGEKCESEAEKRARLLSPMVPTNAAQRVPLRNSAQYNENPPQTVTLSSDTKISTTDDFSFRNDKDKLEESFTNERLRLMSSGRQRQSSEVSHSSSSTRTGRNNEGLSLMAENNCLEAHAAFSDTVHLAREKTMLLDDDEQYSMKSLAPTQPSNLTTDFSVYCDPDPTIHMPTERSKSRSTGLNLVFDEQKTTSENEKVNEDADEDVQEVVSCKISPKSLVTPPSTENLFDDSIISGFSMPSQRNIVTSTPAIGIPFVGVEEYFGNSEPNEEKQQDDVMFAIPDTKGTLQNRGRRKSMAPTTKPMECITEKSREEPKKSGDESLSEMLGRRLSLGADEIMKQVREESADQYPPQEEETGRKDRRRSEVIRGELNPWDFSLREKIMKLVRPPTNMHELPAQKLKVQAMKTIEVGGEKYDIRTLLGQGGYARVYKAINEEKKEVAVKYEMPPCAWEVYICDQMRNRLIKKGGSSVMKIADFCIMQVIDAYILPNFSLLVNEFHEYGTLLDNVNNSKDPNWHISAFLVVQLAKIIREVHDAKIIHGDIKPDNFMITKKIDLNWQKEELMTSDVFVIKLIDWGRAIDMATLQGKSFTGSAGTEQFDCPEMKDGRPWTYQPDYFGFAHTMTILITGKYCDLKGSIGDYSLDVEIKRRNNLRETAEDIIDKCCNIKSSNSLPDWTEMIDQLMSVWDSNFDASAWKQAASKFNEACEKAKS